MMDWRLHTDCLRCSPQFFGAPRFDCVSIQMIDEKVILGHLLFLFECPDKDLGLFRVRARPRAEAQFIPLQSIIRGALPVQDGYFDFLVVDTVDSDMFLRVKKMHLEAEHLIHV
ncbi:hypothetical protein K503DRAFT_709034 [Rhizopogon vinicolor AM-OR11-026]|uniref:Uncharacterized protein n=1 Tax=Rhizopogon vinicolor AM-OR11-026 TaxID=1314800 RepID=A0A1B7NE49_9AGAM|nr:hypothetical protein K503DRAFT_709034 [Rhizopogon vinicolor AM-OR11-026]